MSMSLKDSYNFIRSGRYSEDDYFIGTELSCVPFDSSYLDKYGFMNVKRIDISNPDMVVFIVSDRSYTGLIQLEYDVPISFIS